MIIKVIGEITTSKCTIYCSYYICDFVRMKLYKNGKDTFIRACQLMDNALKQIEIQMFIWRDDEIGNVMLKHVYNALDRGIKVLIKKDAFGSIFEKSEENKQSLFHKDKIKGLGLFTKGIDLMYADDRKPKGYHQRPNQLLDLVMNHPNLIIKNEILKDHTKYYIIDDHILFMGGVNIEDKENGQDIQGRTYKDYMIEIDDKKICKLL